MFITKMTNENLGERSDFFRGLKLTLDEHSADLSCLNADVSGSQIKSN